MANPPRKASELAKETLSILPPLTTAFSHTIDSSATCANPGPPTMDFAHRSSEQEHYMQTSPHVYAPMAEEGAFAAQNFAHFLRSEMNISPPITNHLPEVDNIPHPRFALPQPAAMERYSKTNEIAIQEYIARENALQQCGHARIDDDDSSAVNDHVYPPFDPASCLNMAFENSPQGHQLAGLYRDLATATMRSELPALTTTWSDTIIKTPTGYAIHGPSVLAPYKIPRRPVYPFSPQADFITPITHISPGNYTNVSQNFWPATGPECNSLGSADSSVMVASDPATPGSFVSVASDNFSLTELSANDEPSSHSYAPSSSTCRSNDPDTGSSISESRGRSESPMFPMDTATEPAKTASPSLRVRSDSPGAKDLDKSIRKVETDLIVNARALGMKYKDIMKLSKFKISESTLRGRVRNATLPYKKRPRVPVWLEDDEALLQVAVNRHYLHEAYGVSANSSRPPWNKIGLWMSENGASHGFSGRACHKKWDKLNGL